MGKWLMNKYLDVRVGALLGTGNCVVDLGCGSGGILSELEGQFAERIGLDISRQRIDMLSRINMNGWRFQEADLNKQIPLDSGSVDALIANQVIEHILEPFKFAKEIHRVLRDGARCVVTTPNVRYVKHIGHLLLSGYGPRTGGENMLDGEWDDGHVHYFTHRDLHDVFRNAGFKKVNSRALINVGDGYGIRRLLDRWGYIWIVREFLSGCILLSAEK